MWAKGHCLLEDSWAGAQTPAGSLCARIHALLPQSVIHLVKLCVYFFFFFWVCVSRAGCLIDELGLTMRVYAFPVKRERKDKKESGGHKDGEEDESTGKQRGCFFSWLKLRVKGIKHKFTAACSFCVNRATHAHQRTSTHTVTVNE